MLDSSASSAVRQCPQLPENAMFVLNDNEHNHRLAKEFLVSYCTTDEGLATIFATTSSQETIKAVVERNDTGKLNVLEVIMSDA